MAHTMYATLREHTSTHTHLVQLAHELHLLPRLGLCNLLDRARVELLHALPVVLDHVLGHLLDGARAVLLLVVQEPLGQDVILKRVSVVRVIHHRHLALQ
mgnify:CR=1 FL=1